ncbi:hypothetical protein ACET3Z_031086 [Daucus carota]
MIHLIYSFVGLKRRGRNTALEAYMRQRLINLQGNIIKRKDRGPSAKNQLQKLASAHDSNARIILSIIPVSRR